MKRIILLTLALTLSLLTAVAQSPTLKEGVYYNEDGAPFTGTATLEVSENGKAQKQYIEVLDGLLHGQQSIVFFFDHLVALACGLFQTRAVQYLNVASCVADHASTLQAHGGFTHTLTAHT